MESGQDKVGPVAALAEVIQLDGGSEIHGDAALVGSTVTIGAQVDGNLTAIGSTVTLNEGAEINGDAMLTGKMIVINDAAQVNGNVTVAGENITISRGAEINGSVTRCAVTFDPALLKSLPEGQSGGCPQAAAQAERASAFAPLLASFALSGLAALAVTIFP